MAKGPLKYRQRMDTAHSLVEEIRAVPGLGQTISVRAAKAHLSALLELVASGADITITSGGQPKAHLVGVGKAKPVRGFKGANTHLAKMPSWKGGHTGEQIVRADRDDRA